MRHALPTAALLIGLPAVGWISLAQEQGSHPPIRQEAGGAGVDFTACAECHAEESAAPVIHPALEMGCESCHEVDQDDDFTEIFLSVEGNDLCFVCHGDMQPEQPQPSLHAPVRTGRCIECHDPHASETVSLLRRGVESREAAENLCLGCHKEIEAQIQKPTLHMAVDLGCAACHTTHKSEPAETEEGLYHLVSPQPDLCLACHDAEDGALKEAHSNQPFGSARCTECHNPHGSDAPKLVNNFIHGAFEMGCETCHEEPQEGKVVLQEGAGREMCLMCHSEIEEEMGKAQFTHFPLEMDSGCIACHSPHAATYRHQLRRGPVKTCFDCHTELAEARASKDHLHRPVFEQSCVICHRPHTGDRKRLLRAEVNDLCLACHGSQMRTLVGGSEAPELFDGTVALESGALDGIPLIPVQPGGANGHPMGAHPVTSEEGDLTCLSCHVPHAANGSASLFITESPTSTDLCVQCH